MTSPSQDPHIGTTFAGRWLVERPLAFGGMGAVYIAREVENGRSVALKLIKPTRANDAELVSRFRREAAALAAIRHPNVVAFLDAGFDNDTLFLVMELLQGRSLRRAQLEAFPPRLGWRRAFHIGSDVCRGLAALHQAGIVHRDLKPENIFLSETAAGESAKLLDLGIVRLDDSAATGLHSATAARTMTGIVVGTPGYISPEQLFGRDATATSDIYAVGVVLYELITGRLPFEAANLEELLFAQVATPYVPLRAQLPSLPEHVDTALARLLARDPAVRVASANEALQFLTDATLHDDLAPDAPTEGISRAAALAALSAHALPAVPPTSSRSAMPATTTGTVALGSLPPRFLPAPMLPAPVVHGRMRQRSLVAAMAVALGALAVIAARVVWIDVTRDQTSVVPAVAPVGALLAAPVAGKTPVALEIPAGSHQGRSPGNTEQEQKGNVTSGETVRVAAKLPRMSPDDVRALVRKQADDLQLCGDGSEERSALVTAFPSGRVEASTTPDDTPAKCLTAMAARWRVPKFKGAPVSITVDVTLGR